MYDGQIVDHGLYVTDAFNPCFRYPPLNVKVTPILLETVDHYEDTDGWQVAADYYEEEVHDPLAADAMRFVAMKKAAPCFETLLWHSRRPNYKTIIQRDRTMWRWHNLADWVRDLDRRLTRKPPVKGPHEVGRAYLPHTLFEASYLWHFGLASNRLRQRSLASLWENGPDEVLPSPGVTMHFFSPLMAYINLIEGWKLMRNDPFYNTMYAYALTGGGE